MPRGLRKDTFDRIAGARERKPLGLGPYLGALACRANISAGQVGAVVSAHETTVFRWFFGQGEVAPQWAYKVARLVALLVWMQEEGLLPLEGTLEERTKLLIVHGRKFEALARSSGQAARAAA